MTQIKHLRWPTEVPSLPIQSELRQPSVDYLTQVIAVPSGRDRVSGRQAYQD